MDWVNSAQCFRSLFKDEENAHCWQYWKVGVVAIIDNRPN